MKKILIINAIVWAILILLGSYLFKDHENWKYFFIALIFGFTTINTFLTNNQRKSKKCTLE